MDSDTQQNEKMAVYLAKELGGLPLQVGPCWFNVCLVADSRPGILCNKGFHFKANDPKMWTVSGIWPTDNDGDRHTPPTGQSPSIGVSKSRGREVLVAEIRRRLAADYEALHAKMMEKVEEFNAAYAAADESRKQITEQHLGRVSPSSKSQMSFPNGYGLHQVQIDMGGQVTLKTYALPLATALKVMEVLRDNQT